MTDNANTVQTDLGTEKISKLLWRFTVPAVVGLVVNSLYNIVDRIFVGNGVGALGLGAIAVSFPVVIFMMAVGMMVGVGGSVNFSVRLGQKKILLAEKFLTNAVVLIFVFAVTVCLFLFVFLDKILGFLGTTDAIRPYAETYIRICLTSGVFFMVNIVLNNFIRACGHPRYAMGSLIVGAVLNLVFDPIFIFVLNKGIAGAAAATVIAQTASFFWSASFFVFKSPFKIRRKYLVPRVKVSLSILHVGMAQFAIQLCGGFVQTLLNRSLKAYGGDNALSAMSVSTTTVLFLLMPVIGLCEGAQPIVGFNFGAQKFDRVRRVYKIMLTGATVICVFSWIFINSQTRFIALLFNPNDPVWLETALMALHTASLALPTVGMQIATSLFLQATKKPRAAMFLVLSRQLLLLIPALKILPSFFGLYGVYLAIPVSDFVCFLFAFVLMLRQLNHYKKVQKTQNTDAAP